MLKQSKERDNELAALRGQVTRLKRKNAELQQIADYLRTAETRRGYARRTREILETAPDGEYVFEFGELPVSPEVWKLILRNTRAAKTEEN